MRLPFPSVETLQHIFRPIDRLSIFALIVRKNVECLRTCGLSETANQLRIVCMELYSWGKMSSLPQILFPLFMSCWSNVNSILYMLIV